MFSQKILYLFILVSKGFCSEKTAPTHFKFVDMCWLGKRLSYVGEHHIDFCIIFALSEDINLSINYVKSPIFFIVIFSLHLLISCIIKELIFIVPHLSHFLILLFHFLGYYYEL